MAAALALVGLIVTVVGVLQATVFAPASTTRASLTGAGQPVITTAVGVLELEGPRVQADVTDSAGRPVFIGIGRAADVDAYLGEVARLQVRGQDGDGGLLTRREGTEKSLPDPARADVWVSSERGTGSAGLVWPTTPGQWRLVVATDGTAKVPTGITLTWSGREVHSSAPVLIGVGLVLLVLGLLTLAVLWTRSARLRARPVRDGRT